LESEIVEAAWEQRLAGSLVQGFLAVEPLVPAGGVQLSSAVSVQRRIGRGHPTAATFS